MFLGVHGEQPHSGATNGCQSQNLEILQAKVLAPHVFSRMEEPDGFSCIRVDARQVGTLVKIAARTGKGEIIWGVGTAMLERQNMLHMKRQHGVFLVHAAIFAARACPLDNGSP